jgi:hypothetical protein
MVRIGSLSIALASFLLDDSRLEIPPPAAIARARELVNALFAAELAAPAGSSRQREGARRLLDRSSEPRTEPPQRFVLLSLTRDLALAGGDQETSLLALEQLCDGFRVEPGLALDSLTVAHAGSSDPDSSRRRFDFALRLAAASLRRLEWPAADALLERAAAFIPGASDPGAPARLETARTRRRELEAGRGAYELAAARTDLQPPDAGARRIAGRYLAFLLDDWERGLPLLALGDDSATAAAAALELRRPAEPSQLVQIADAWWELAEAETPAARRSLELHSARVARPILGELEGGERTRLERRLTAFDPAPSRPKDTLKLATDEWALRHRTGDRWNSVELERKQYELKAGGLAVRNVSAGSEIVKLAYVARTFASDFCVWIDYRGQLKTIELTDVGGADSQMYVEKIPIATKWRTIVVRRDLDGLRAWLDGTPLPLENYNSTERATCYFTLRLDPGMQVELRDLAVRGGSLR